MTTAMTPSQKAVSNKRNEIRALLQQCSGRYQEVLQGTLLRPERMIGFAMTALTRNPKLMDCAPVSVAFALQLASEAGLPVDGYHAHLVPYGNTCQFIPDYKGLVQLSLENGVIIDAAVVYSKDKFVYQLGLNPRIDHVPCDDEDRGEKTHAYAIATFQDGRKKFVVANRGEIEKRRASSRARSKDTPWQMWEDEMWMKTACKMLAKFIPRSPRMTAAIMNDDMVESGKLHMHERAIEYQATMRDKLPNVLDEEIASQAAKQQEEEEPAPADDFQLSKFLQGVQACETVDDVNALYQEQIRDRKPTLAKSDIQEAHEACQARASEIRSAIRS